MAKDIKVSALRRNSTASSKSATAEELLKQYKECLKNPKIHHSILDKIAKKYYGLTGRNIADDVKMKNSTKFKITREQADSIGLIGRNGEEISDKELEHLNDLLNKHGITNLDSVAAFLGNSQLETGNWKLNKEERTINGKKGYGPGYGALQLTGPGAKDKFYDWAIKNGYASSKPTDAIKKAEEAKKTYEANKTDANKHAWWAAEDKVNDDLAKQNLFWETGVWYWTETAACKTAEGSINDYFNKYSGKIKSENLMYMSGMWVKGVDPPAKYWKELKEGKKVSLRDTSSNEHKLVFSDGYSIDVGRMGERYSNYKKIKGILD